ncbi:hypothetical protein KBP30_38005 [Streptomyces sp. Go40/10]|uniref:hypothetical protein n=1 Tax=Streptomyces sp. Go40/10 TaxID=2825844 RepID=UPI001E28D3D0|nr:hypothetical protein [Streptomyces sp. Go40/10]UFR07665.1 hypothetical protein KBP30_38005 [Streptomyces sp. Go40/10]
MTPDARTITGKAQHARFGDRLPARTLSGVASLALPGMLFEVDAVAVRPAVSPGPVASAASPQDA